MPNWAAPRVSSTGNLKLDVPPPSVDEGVLKLTQEMIGKRPVIVAASTHQGEEIAVIQRRTGDCERKFPTLLTVIVPRHPVRGQSIADIAQVAGQSVALRSQRAQPMPDIGVYVADTLGELGLFYRLAPIVFMGGSLAEHGGQNPIEAIRLGAAVLHGPHVWNFAEIYGTLDEARGANLVQDEEALTERIGAWLADAPARQTVAEAAAKTVAQLGGGLQRTLAALDPYYVMQPSPGRNSGHRKLGSSPRDKRGLWVMA